MVDNIGPKQKGLAFNEHFRLFNSVDEFLECPCPTAKVIFHQYIEAFGRVKNKYEPGWYTEQHDQDLCNRIITKYNRRFIEAILPEIQFIHLTRDPVSQAVSLYFARETKKYHIYDETSLKSYLDAKIEINEEKLLQAYQHAKQYHSIWSDFAKNAIQINYNSLVTNPVTTVELLLNTLNIEADAEKSVKKSLENPRIHRMTRLEAMHVESLLKKRLVKML